MIATYMAKCIDKGMELEIFLFGVAIHAELSVNLQISDETHLATTTFIAILYNNKLLFIAIPHNNNKLIKVKLTFFSCSCQS